jgi:hypothetical protein
LGVKVASLRRSDLGAPDGAPPQGDLSLFDSLQR